MYWMTHDGPTSWTRCGYPLGKKRAKKLKKAEEECPYVLTEREDAAAVREMAARHHAQKYTPWF